MNARLPFTLSPNSLLVAIDDWKTGSNVNRPMCFGARLLFGDCLDPLMKCLRVSGAHLWHASGDRAKHGFLFNSPQFDQIMGYLDSGHARYFTMMQGEDEFSTPELRAQADELVTRHPSLAPLLPAHPQAVGFYWFLDRLVNHLVDEFGTERPIQVLVDRFDWDRRTHRSGGGGPVPFGASTKLDLSVFSVANKSDPALLDAVGLLGLIDSELWAFGRLQTLPLSDGTTLRSRSLQWQQNGRQESEPLLTESEHNALIRPHISHPQLLEYWKRSLSWIPQDRWIVLQEP